jgi:peroxiredoxin
LVDLEQLLAQGPVVISFNRGHWCPFCKIELATLAEAHRDFAELGAQVTSIIGEACGARWDEVDLDAKVWTSRRAA